jgi:MFS transporter, DHA1 family, tetracycline resistance protein
VLYRLLPIVLLNTLSIGMMWPALPDILLDDFQKDSAAVATFLARMSALNAVLDIITNPILGALSDKYGRRNFLLQSLGVAAFCDFIIAFVGSPSAILLAKVMFGMLDCTKPMW